jgi:hypothetical protein
VENEEMRNEHKVFVGKPEKKRPFGKARHRWEMQTKTSLRMRK